MQQSVPNQPATNSHAPNRHGGRVVYGMPHHAPYGANPYHYATNPYHYQQYPVYPYPPMVDPYTIYQQQQALYGQFPATMEQLHQLRCQVEFYFSYENLVGDKYLLAQMDEHKGMVPCHVVANFRRVIGIMGGVPASNQLLTLALLHSNIVRVLFGQFLVPSAGVFSRVLEARGRTMQHHHANDDATAATVSSSTSSRNSKDGERRPDDSQTTSLADPEDNAELSPPPGFEEECFEEKKEDDIKENISKQPEPRPLKEEEDSSIDEDNSKLLRGILGLNINEDTQ